MELTKDLLEILHKNGFTLEPINRGEDAIKDEPKWAIAKLKN